MSLSGPLIVAIDDVQWSDPQSIALLHHLVRGADADGEALGLILTGRPSPTLSALCASLERLLADRLIHIRLGPLDNEAALELVQLVNPLLPQDEAEQAANRSGGSPFWCELLATAGSETTDVPQFVSDRLRGASADAWDVLASCVLLARPVHAAREIAEIQGWRQDRVDNVLDELSATGLIVEDGSALRAAHDLVRTAVSSQIPDSERRRAHTLIASWLEDGARDDVSLLLAAAQHRRAAGVRHAASLERILRSPMRRSVGLDGLRAIAELIDDVSPSDPAAVELQRGLAALAGELGQHTMALERWPRVAKRLGAPTERARAWLAACDEAQRLELAHEARAFLEEATKLPGGDPVLALELSAAEASLMRWLENRPDDAQDLTNQALARARELVSCTPSLEQVDPKIRSVYLKILVQASVGAQQRNALNDILTLADEISEVAAGLDAQASVQAQLRSGSALMLVGRFAEAEGRLADAWSDARRSFLSDLALDVGSWLVWTRYLMGRLVEADEVASECAALSARNDDHTRPTAILQLFRQTIEVSRGDRGAALDALGALAQEEPDAHYRLFIHQTIARWLARLPVGTSTADARSALHAGRMDADSAGCTRCRMEFLLSGSEALAASWVRCRSRGLAARGRARRGPRSPRPVARRASEGLGRDRGGRSLRCEDRATDDQHGRSVGDGPRSDLGSDRPLAAALGDLGATFIGGPPRGPCSRAERGRRDRAALRGATATPIRSSDLAERRHSGDRSRAHRLESPRRRDRPPHR